MKNYWKMFIFVFLVAFGANVVVACLFEQWFGGSGFHWDTTTSTAAATALVISWILNKKRN